MYDVVQMTKEFEEAVQVVSRRIQGSFVAAFREIYKGDCIPDRFPLGSSTIKAASVSMGADLLKITAGAGFYIILTDYPVQGNVCRLSAGRLRAVYRGECREVRLRVTSHLFNSAYRTQHESRALKYVQNPRNKGKLFYKELWPHCMKLEADGPSGIDMDQKPYSDYQWLVVVHHMEGSSQGVRKIAETAFDEVFGHPEASRDV